MLCNVLFLNRYGEVVHAAVVAKEGSESQVTEADIQAHCRAKLADFKIPIRIHFLRTMPKTPTGKVQRRMVRTFVLENGGSAPAKPAEKKGEGQGEDPKSDSGEKMQGFDVAAKCLAALGVKTMVGIVGIPVTQVASSAQCEGIRFVGFRNEQAAGYAASCIGFLTGAHAVLLTVSGPGVVHGLAGLANATANCWPLLMISGSVERKHVGKGGFQELDQCAAAKGHCKAVFRVKRVADMGSVLSSALDAALSGRPGGVYVDIPADVLFAEVQVRLARLPAFAHVCYSRLSPLLSLAHSLFSTRDFIMLTFLFLRRWFVSPNSCSLPAAGQLGMDLAGCDAHQPRRVSPDGGPGGGARGRGAADDGKAAAGDRGQGGGVLSV